MDELEPLGSTPPSDFTVATPVNFDLEVYANSYDGLTKVRRLLFVAKHCPALQVEALKLVSLDPRPPQTYTCKPQFRDLKSKAAI